MTKRTAKKSRRRISVSDLTEAVLLGSLVDVKRLIQAGANVNGSKRDGSTPLTLAAARGDPKITAYLIERGAGVNRSNEIGQTALMIAAQRGNKEIIQQLVAAGADAQTVDNKKRNAIAWAVTRGDFAEVISLLVAFGTDYNAPDSTGITPLMRAALLGYANCAAVLLTAGANEKVRFHGKTAYEMADEKGHREVCDTIRAVVQSRPKGHAL